jgi:hypothetical protein
MTGAKVSSLNMRISGVAFLRSVGEKKKPFFRPSSPGGDPPHSTVAPKATASSTCSCASSTRALLMHGPMLVDGSLPGPTLTARIRSEILRANSSYIPSCHAKTLRPLEVHNIHLHGTKPVCENRVRTHISKRNQMGLDTAREEPSYRGRTTSNASRDNERNVRNRIHRRLEEKRCRESGTTKLT